MSRTFKDEPYRVKLERKQKRTSKFRDFKGEHSHNTMRTHANEGLLIFPSNQVQNIETAIASLTDSGFTCTTTEIYSLYFKDVSKTVGAVNKINLGEAKELIVPRYALFQSQSDAKMFKPSAMTYDIITNKDGSIRILSKLMFRGFANSIIDSQPFYDTHLMAKADLFTIIHCVKEYKIDQSCGCSHTFAFDPTMDRHCRCEWCTTRPAPEDKYGVPTKTELHEYTKVYRANSSLVMTDDIADLEVAITI